MLSRQKAKQRTSLIATPFQYIVHKFFLLFGQRNLTFQPNKGRVRYGRLGIQQTDGSNHFLPQDQIHPVLLSRTSFRVSLCIKTSSQHTMSRKTTRIYFKIYNKHMKKLCGKDKEFLDVTARCAYSSNGMLQSI
jgi:hypothetical protein